MQMNLQGKIIVVLLIAFIASVGFIVFDQYDEARAKEQLDILQQGVQLGYEQAILQVMQQASTCQQVPLFAGNQTMNLIAVACLPQAVS